MKPLMPQRVDSKGLHRQISRNHDYVHKVQNRMVDGESEDDDTNSSVDSD